MLGAIFEILLVIALGVIFILLFGLLRALPFMTGLLGSVFLFLVFPRLKDIIPGETKLSVITLIVVIEFIIAILTFNQQTSGPMIVFSCLMFVDLIMGLSYGSFECASWQKATFVTVVYLAVTYFILASNCDSLKVDRDDSRNIIVSLVVACMYAASVGATLLVILGAIWEKFVKLKFSEGFYNAYDKTGIVLIIVAMAVTALGSVVRDRVSA